MELLNALSLGFLRETSRLVSARIIFRSVDVIREVA